MHGRPSATQMHGAARDSARANTGPQNLRLLGAGATSALAAVPTSFKRLSGVRVPRALFLGKLRRGARRAPRTRRALLELATTPPPLLFPHSRKIRN